MRAASASIAAASLPGDVDAGAEGGAEGVAGPFDAVLGSAELAMSTVGTGCDTAGEGDCADEIDSALPGNKAALGCVVELDGGVLGGAVLPAGALGALGAAAGAICRFAPRPSILPVA
jgi:hypothetical protein